MKKLVIINILLIFNFLNVYADEKIYYLDIDLILNNSNSGKIIVEKLKIINSKNIIELEANEKELKDLENEISKVKNILSENELKIKINKLKKKIILYRSEKDKKVKQFNIIKNKELKIFFKKISPLIEEFMKKNSINMILDKKNIFIANSKYDITNDLIKFLNEKNL